MKNKLFTISFIAVILLSSCSADNNSSSANSDLNKSVTQTTSSSVGTETKGKLSSTTAQTANENSGMTEQEVLDLGKKEGTELKQLYRGFLKFGAQNLESVQVDWNDTKKATLPEFYNDDNLYQYNHVISSKFKTYNQLYDYFCTFCTPEYSTALLTDTTNIYTNIDGDLYVFGADGGFTGNTDSSIDSYKLTDDTIIYTCKALIDEKLNPDYDANNIDKYPQHYDTYTLTIKKINDKWYIDSCSDFFTLVYTWQ